VVATLSKEPGRFTQDTLEAIDVCSIVVQGHGDLHQTID
jgi:hypothetical protein